ncbi:MAG TPA: DUF1016 domain-containing protein [Bacteroidales bacterium]|nr:MAG: hypothetical protein A2W98_02530 [Bacteroidetes bacterium GWF2_33_38]OFY68563.1 MAG: hypothetical protein A2265_09465 [Bacteroidetes bacterium RIFOXYA12_FULL_33_9]OFY92010.1 MAG: hypothetical protein A2236_11205 [Bacteroidetes bacterium RIFOXYA2_FULL_33_7]HBF89509.1 DUF1016 domain-containing protein [Bacteroidales bacterium]
MENEIEKTNNKYILYIKELKNTILNSQYNAARLVNKEILILYYTIGKSLSAKTLAEKWGAKVLENISDDLQKEMPGLRGFSVTSLKKMRQFAETYSFFEISPLPTVQIMNKQISPLSTDQLEIFTHATNQIKVSIKKALQLTKSSKHQFGNLTTEQIDNLVSPEFSELFLSISFTQHILLLSKISNWNELFFYLAKSVKNQWTVSLLQHHIESDLFNQKNKLQSNFEKSLPQKLYPHALQAFKDEYLLDFLNIKTEKEQDEKVFESEIIRNIKKFILSIGNEFTFMGNQYRLIVGEDEFFVDLLFYHRGLQALIAFELKTGKFKPEYAGKMNFYLNALDEYVKLPNENPSIGIILCKEKNNTIVEFSFKSIEKPIGVATYKTSKELPDKYKKFLQGIEKLNEVI